MNTKTTRTLPLAQGGYKSKKSAELPCIARTQFSYQKNMFHEPNKAHRKILLNAGCMIRPKISDLSAVHRIPNV